MTVDPEDDDGTPHVLWLRTEGGTLAYVCGNAVVLGGHGQAFVDAGILEPGRKGMYLQRMEGCGGKGLCQSCPVDLSDPDAVRHREVLSISLARARGLRGAPEV